MAWIVFVLFCCKICSVAMYAVFLRNLFCHKTYFHAIYKREIKPKILSVEKDYKYDVWLLASLISMISRCKKCPDILCCPEIHSSDQTFLKNIFKPFCLKNFHFLNFFFSCHLILIPSPPPHHFLPSKCAASLVI